MNFKFSLPQISLHFQNHFNSVVLCNNYVKFNENLNRTKNLKMKYYQYISQLNKSDLKTFNINC